MRRGSVFLLFAAAAGEAGATTYYVTKAEDETRAYRQATEMLMRDLRRAPLAEEWPEILVTAPPDIEKWRGPYIVSVRVDPWGKPYRLQSCPNLRECRIYSTGRNGIDEGGANDDVSSWSGYDEATYFPNAKRNRLIAMLAAAGLLFGAMYGLVRLWRFMWTRGR